MTRPTTVARLAGGELDQPAAVTAETVAPPGRDESGRTQEERGGDRSVQDDAGRADGNRHDEGAVGDSLTAPRPAPKLPLKPWPSTTTTRGS